MPGSGTLRTLSVHVPYGPQNASVRARALEWLDRLAHDDQPPDVVVCGPGFESRRAVRSERALVLRNVSRFSRGGFERRVLGTAGLGVYDVDDGLPWDDGRLPDLGRWWKRPWPRSLIARRAAEAADRVIAGNEVLADWASAHCDDVRVVPTCVEPGDYEGKTRYDIGDRPVIGWLGAPATELYMADIAQPLAAVAQRLGASVEIMSAPGALPPALASIATRVPWSLAAASAIGERWDVGLMPLRDGVYERAKCGYKLLQYAAAGLPSIGSPVGVNARLLQELGSPAPVGIGDWDDALTEVLTATADRRAALGRAGRVVAQQYSFGRWESAWRDALDLTEPSP